MAMALLIFGTVLTALFVLLIVQVVNLQDRREIIELATVGATVIAFVAIAGATALLRIFTPVR
jgi:hypothetical protein